MKTTTNLPFSNNTEYEIWQSRNCDRCDLYENDSTKRNKAKCIFAFDIDFSQASGKIPISTINFFGFNKRFFLCDCPKLHLGREYDFERLQKRREKLIAERAEKEKIEPTLNF